MQKSRVVILTGIYPPDSGGPATFAVSFSNFALKAGFSTDVVSYTDDDSRKTKSGSHSVRLISRKFGLLLRTFVAVFHLVRIFLGKSRVIANGLFIEAYLASKLTKGKYVAKIPGDIVWERAVNSKRTNLEVREFQSSGLNSRYRIFRYLFTKSIMRADVVIVPSTLLFELCLGWGIPKERIHLIYNSVDIDFFHPTEFLGREFDCIVVNRLVAWKNVKEVIHACHALNLSLLIVGDGPESDALRFLAKELGSKVTFAGNVSKETLLMKLQSARFYILNSTADATAYSLLEARSCGLIAVANIKTGASEVINDQIDGVLTRATTQSEIQTVLSGLNEKNMSELQAMSQAARTSTMNSFNKEVNFGLILDLVAPPNAH
jgi:glycosyltransferase involved in cell wall biosynthesis